MDAITAAIEGLTARTIAYRLRITTRRFARHNRIIDERREMRTMAALIEIKGLASAIAGAKKGIADVRAASAGLNESSTALVSELKDVTAQIEAARTDLKFEASTLGNGGEGQSEPPPKPTPPPVVPQETATATHPTGSAASTEPRV